MKIKTALFIAIIMICMTGVAFGGMFVESGEIPESAAAAAEAYWTPERMENAIPYPNGIDGKPQEGDPAGLQETTGEAPGWATSSKTGRPSVLMTQEVGTKAETEIEPAYATYPFPHTTYRISTRVYRRFPNRAVGKVFFRKRTGGNYVCSGSSIGGRAVLTAGHCVSDGRGRWHRNWSFVPAYRRGSRPYSTWYASNLLTFTDWHNRGRFCRDVAIAVTRNRGGRRLSQRVGNLGYAWNRTRSKQHYDSFGYPAARPWTGRDQVQTSAEWARNDSPGCSSPPTIAIGSRHRPGSSGGPWVINFYPDRGGRVNQANGVNSYYYTARPNAIYSPYFDTAVRNLIRSGTRR